MLLAWLAARVGADLMPGRNLPFVHVALLTLLVTGALLFYFDLRARALAPERFRVRQTPGQLHLLSVTFLGRGSLHVPKCGRKPALAS